MSDEVKDVRGIPILPGATVVTAISGSRLMVRTVKRLERPGLPAWWVDVRFTDGFCTTPERCAVVSP